MKNLLLLTICLMCLNLYAEWKMKPNIYSRGGITLKEDLSAKASLKDNFNLGPWSQESNAISDPLTEITLTASQGDSIRYTYGVSVSSNERLCDGSEKGLNERFYDGSEKGLNERLNFVEFLNKNQSIWFGQRAYRGDGDYLTRSFPFDEKNMLGGGVRFEKFGPVNLEFAYGVAVQSAPYNVNMFINKIEYPLSNGKIKSNIELHKVSDSNDANKSMAYMAGVQWQRWGDKLLGGSLYNIALINYSSGYIGGTMESVYKNLNKDKAESKILIKWGGDYKTKKFATFYTFKYQGHKGAEANQSWSYLDIHLRPVYAFFERYSYGVDFQTRLILNDEDSGVKSGASNGEATRIALMIAYNLKDKSFDLPNISMFVGTMSKGKDTDFYGTGTSKKSATFIRLNYEISI